MLLPDDSIRTRSHEQFYNYTVKRRSILLYIKFFINDVTFVVLATLVYQDTVHLFCVPLMETCKENHLIPYIGGLLQMDVKTTL